MTWGEGAEGTLQYLLETGADGGSKDKILIKNSQILASFSQCVGVHRLINLLFQLNAN